MEEKNNKWPYSIILQTLLIVWANLTGPWEKESVLGQAACPWAQSQTASEGVDLCAYKLIPSSTREALFA